MTRITMPDPVAWATPDLSKFFGENEMQTLEHLGGSREKQKTFLSVPLITTHQAEAYANARVKEVQHWQPIETAPMDGTSVLLWATPHSMLFQNNMEIVGRYRRVWQSQTGIPLSHVSHWMPLPPPP